MDTSDILSIFLRGALGARGRKRARRAANFLSGKRGFLTASTLLGAAGVAWGIYDSMQSSPGAAPPIVPGGTGPTGPSSQPGAAPVLPPPIPGSAPAETAALPMDVLRLVRLAISAARADGTLAPAERALILGHARDAGIESTVEDELAAPHQLSAIVGGVTDSQQRQDLYVLAYTIVRADEAVSGAERIYLAQLAHQLGLDAATSARLERETATMIDATPADQAPPATASDESSGDRDRPGPTPQTPSPTEP